MLEGCANLKDFPAGSGRKYGRTAKISGPVSDARKVACLMNAHRKTGPENSGPVNQGKPNLTEGLSREKDPIQIETSDETWTSGSTTGCMTSSPSGFAIKPSAKFLLILISVSKC